MARKVKERLQGFSQEEKSAILCDVHMRFWSVANFCRMNNITRQRFYQIVNAKQLSAEVLAKFNNMLKGGK